MTSKLKMLKGWDLLFAVSILVIVGAVLFMLLVPRPSTDGLSEKYENRTLKASTEQRIAETEAMQLAAENDQWVWNMKAQSIGPEALDAITKLAESHHLTLLGFRPQKTTESDSLEQLSFLISLEGPYPSVLRFEKALEAQKYRLAVNIMQIAASDDTTDNVKASIGVVAYRRTEQGEQLAKN